MYSPFHYMLLVIAVIITNDTIKIIEIIAKKNTPNKTNLLFLSTGMLDIEKATINKPIQLILNQTVPDSLL